jgi:hypothetical protein
MRSRTLTILIGFSVIVSLGSLVAGWRLPGDNRGYEPVQPINYSHRLHAGEMKIACMYCHSGAERSRYAGIPSTSVCMNCHQEVRASFELVQQEAQDAETEDRTPERIISPELRKLYDTLALDDQLRPLENQAPMPVAWVRVHTLPDFVRFDHRPHIWAGVSCQSCHGPVETMERVRQEAPLSMGWCVNCHRDVNEHGVAGKTAYASLDCTTCHY